MTWGRMDDKFHRNPKVKELRKTKEGELALSTWTYWWSWCLDDPELTGVVPEDELKPRERGRARLLVSVGLWDPVPGGYKYHDFHKYNPNKEQRQNKLETDRARSASARGVARDVANDSRATSSPRARAGHGRGTYKLEARDTLAMVPVPLTGDARSDATNADLGLMQPVSTVRRVVR